MKVLNALSFLVLLFAFIPLSSCGENNTSSTTNEEKERKFSERYTKEWSSSFNVGITRALAKNNIKGCGDYKYKRSIQNEGEYLVHCSVDGFNWTAYLVWVPIEKVMGPYKPDPETN